ncbi:fructose-bisphosphate aldolase class I [Candidatus Saccharibacteria bacterium]|nr:fructose-bisphosphate aldolase class I [Candidatus Saccharibacteria bacterium]
MPSILIVGNITKDVYLRLDNRINNFETDQNGVKWLDIAFDNTRHHYYSRVSIYGGASISLEVLSRFGINASISGTPATFLDGQFIAKDIHTTYRYILCQDENTSHLVPSDEVYTSWQVPENNPDWIYLDSSAVISPKLATEILDFLNLSRNTKLALFVGRHANQNTSHIQALIERANLIINSVPLEKTVNNNVYIGNDRIEYQGRRVFWTLSNKRDILTRLSVHLTIAASVLGALALGKEPGEALLLARANAENSKLSSTLNLSTLEKNIADDYYRVQKINEKGESMSEIENTAAKLMTPGKGILAADESGGSIHKKFETMGIPDDEQHRRDYRNIFFTTPDLEKYVSGVILFDETARQTADNGKLFVDYLQERGVIPGIKVDQGLVNFENSDEKYTQGLDDLPTRLKEYYDMGARFAKWRAAFEVTDHSPSNLAISKNCEILANYAHDCQNANIVPIVEPELVYDGNYSIEQNIEYTGKILDCLFDELEKKQINLAGCILKVNMVLAGKQQSIQSTPAEVGRATAQVLREHVPRNLAGVVFLSGGQSVTQATENLQAVTNNGPFPWAVTFSYARALQDPALQAWRGDNNNADAAREAFKARLIANTEALKVKQDAYQTE